LTEWFNSNEEFVVGDGRTYGGFLNHGPLAEGRDYHVTMGVVSTMNNVTKVSYASVTHDQVSILYNFFPSLLMTRPKKLEDFH
jgi:hypothetical protein